MGRNGKWSAQVCIEVGGETIPYLEIDSEGVVTVLVSQEKQQEYEQAMLKNIGESMSRFYTANPEYLTKERINETRQQET